MELLVATLAYTSKANEADTAARIRLISASLRNAPGAMDVRIFQSRESESFYLLLTTWENEELWHKAQERYNPKELLQASELLTMPPRQWLMHYLWGYSRPSAEAAIAAAHIATISPEQAEQIQRSWLEGLRRQASQPTMSFAFLARGRNEDVELPSVNGTTPFSSTFLNVICWPGETQRREFYSDPIYKALMGALNSIGVVRLLSLYPLSN